MSNAIGYKSIQTLKMEIALIKIRVTTWLTQKIKHFFQLYIQNLVKCDYENLWPIISIYMDVKPLHKNQKPNPKQYIDWLWEWFYNE